MRILAAVVAALIAAANGPAGATPVRDIVARVQKSAEAGDFTAATSGLQQAEAECAATPDDSSCRALVAFTRGYVNQQWAAADPGYRDAHLRDAAAAYSQARELAPDSEAIWRNECLVRKDLGDWDFVKSSLDQATERWPALRVRHLTMVGDMCADADHAADAQAYYRQALVADPADEAAQRSLLAVQRRDPTITAATLLEQARTFLASEQREPAAQSLELAIARSYRDQPRVADAALWQWVDVRLAQQNLSASSLRSLPPGDSWSTPALTELQGLLAEPPQVPTGGRWRDSLLGRDVAARVLLTVARTVRARGDLAQAVTILQQARDLGPRFEDYRLDELKGRPNTELDAALELCILYNNLGRDHDWDFAELEHQLFNEKTFAIASGDLASIQRYHTVLALIYVDRKRFASDWADNAVFQLEHALRAAQQREQAEPGLLQPLPELRSLLGDAYLERARATSGTTAANLLDQAAQAYGEAARACLDVDRLDVAQQMLEEQRASGGRLDDRERRQARALARILATRRQLDEPGGAPWRVSAAGQPQLTSADDWVNAHDDLGLDPAFVGRQRFKTLCDLGQRAQDAGDVAAAHHFEAAALETLTPGTRLAHARDVERLEKIQRSFARQVSFRGAGKLVDARPPAKSDRDRSVRLLYAPARDGAQPLAVGEDLFVAGAILREPAVGKSLRDRQVMVTVRDGQVMVDASALDAPKAAVTLTTLRKIAPVREIRRR